MGDRLQVLGLYWDGEEPALHWRPASEWLRETFFLLPAGAHLSFRVHAPRMCIGYCHALTGIRQPCPTTRIILPGEGDGQCVRCQQRGGGFYARTGLVGKPNESTDRLRKEPHVAYLALFGLNLVKVGVAARRRRNRRVLEQGASAALFFGAGDGDTMRGLEQEVITRAGVQDKVRLETKMPLFWDQPDYEAAEAALRRCCERVRHDCSSHYLSKLLGVPEFAYNVPRFQLDGSVATTNQLVWVREITPGDVIAGRLVGVMGTVMLMRSRDGAVYAVDGRVLQGHLVEHVSATQAHFVGPIRYVDRPAVQGLLFDR